MTERAHFTADQAREVGEAIGIDWSVAPFDVEQFRAGMDVELEHGDRDPATDVTGSDPIVTAKIALAHLNEFPDYYTRLARMEAEIALQSHGHEVHPVLRVHRQHAQTVGVEVQARGG